MTGLVYFQKWTYHGHLNAIVFFVNSLYVYQAAQIKVISWQIDTWIYNLFFFFSSDAECPTWKHLPKPSSKVLLRRESSRAPSCMSLSRLGCTGIKPVKHPCLDTWQRFENKKTLCKWTAVLDNFALKQCQRDEDIQDQPQKGQILYVIWLFTLHKCIERFIHSSVMIIRST